MKKVTKALIFLFLALIVGTLFSCKSTPEPVSDAAPPLPSLVADVEPEPPPPADVEPPPPIDDAEPAPPMPPSAPIITGGTLPEINARYRPSLNTAGATAYTVVWRDYLAGLANRFWGRGNGFYFPLIMLASGDTVTDPDFILPGARLTIPNLKANLDDPDTRAQIKLYLDEVAGWYERERPRDTVTAAGLHALAAKL